MGIGIARIDRQLRSWLGLGLGQPAFRHENDGDVHDWRFRVDEDRKGGRLLEKRGVRAELRVYPGVGHELPPALRRDFVASLSKSLAR